MIDGINQLPAPLPIFTKPGHIIANSWLVGKKSWNIPSMDEIPSIFMDDLDDN